MDRLLLVEHDLLFRDGLALLLEWRTGLSSIRVGSLAEARRVLEETTQKPACIIVDLDLPGGGGPELLEELDGMPVLALIKDGGLGLGRQAQAFASGADEVLRTSGSAEEIAAAVERLLGPKAINVF